MPLKLNIGLSKKVGEANYGSRGASVNVELELDSGLVSEPAKLKDRIRHLFGVVRESLAEELNGNGKHPATDAYDSGQHNGQEDSANGSGRPAFRAATASQVKALYAICKNKRTNLAQLVSDRFGAKRPEDLSLQQASQLIDHLKSERK